MSFSQSQQGAFPLSQPNKPFSRRPGTGGARPLASLPGSASQQQSAWSQPSEEFNMPFAAPAQGKLRSSLSKLAVACHLLDAVTAYIAFLAIPPFTWLRVTSFAFLHILLQLSA